MSKRVTKTCGTPLEKGFCKKPILKNKTKCHYHSLNIKDLCGRSTKTNGFCKSIKGKCPIHNNYKAPIKKTGDGEICSGINRNGESCNKYRIYNSLYCFAHSVAPEDHCGTKLTKSNKYCMNHKATCHIHSFNRSSNQDDGEDQIDQDSDKNNDNDKDQDQDKDDVEQTNTIFKYLVQIPIASDDEEDDEDGEQDDEEDESEDKDIDLYSDSDE